VKIAAGTFLATWGSIFLTAVAPAQTPQAIIQSIRVQLYYEQSGTLSANIAPPAKFSGWNTVIGQLEAFAAGL